MKVFIAICIIIAVPVIVGKKDINQKRSTKMSNYIGGKLETILAVKPKLVWKLTESWKTEGSNYPSDRYMTVLRIVSGAAIGVGILLLVEKNF